MIIDASVAFKWIVEEPGSDAADALVGRGDLFVPHLLFSEVGHAWWKRVSSGEVDPMEPFERHFRELRQVVVVVDESEVQARALELAIRFKHPVYDCVYLALAEARDDELITADDKFLKALGGSTIRRRVRSLQ